MNNYEQTFLLRYEKLNENQKKAVNSIDGTVMVIAGPGTGKTEILAMRIANLLRSDAQIQAHEILCLTYTDEGSVAMRKRLLQIIGQDAHKVHIFTFHAFCNHIIQTNPEYFGIRELQPISDLERTEVLHHLLEKLPEGHLFRKLKGNIYQESRNLISLFETMKRENWSPEWIEINVETYLDSLPERDYYIYKKSNSKKGIKAGDLKQNDIQKEKERMERTLAAVRLFPEYQKTLIEMGRYDFNDMILWVTKAFEENKIFLQNYQERFQYVLVDEFQDTSGAQSHLLHLLMDYWESPNLFVVGDDDQSIYEFQGARIKNILELNEKYSQNSSKGVEIIVLKENYRSTQPILDAAAKLINHNKERLVNKITNVKLDKNIISANPEYEKFNPEPPKIKAYCNSLHEDAAIVQAIEQLQVEGVALNKIAVLYAQHKQAESIVKLLDRKKIPYWIKKPVNILSLPLIIQILDIFKYIFTEHKKAFSGEEYLFRMLHMPFFDVSPVDVANISLHIQAAGYSNKLHYRGIITDHLKLASMNLDSTEQIHRLGQQIYQWLGGVQNLTIAMLLEQIVYDSGILAHILKSENSVWDMQVLHTFFQFVNEETARNPRLNIESFLNIIEKMHIEDIPIVVQKVMRQENGVRFYTAFGAKGHEFEYVFLIGATNKHWEKKRNNNSGYKYPDTLTNTVELQEKSSTEEVMRRVFYVALTRAKKYLQVSYALLDNQQKSLEASQFLGEMSEGGQQNAEQELIALDDNTIMQHLAWAMTPAPPIDIELARNELIERRLENFALSASTLNAYIKCPVSFYYDVILQAPGAKSDALAFGTAVHYALEKMFVEIKNHPQSILPDIQNILENFEKSMWRQRDAFTALQYERRKELGRNILSDYCVHYAHIFNKNVMAELMIKNVQVRGIPLKGKIDKIEFGADGCTVVDYKTGNPDYSLGSSLEPPNDKNLKGGDYWRQMVFYKILMDVWPTAKAHGWKMKQGLFDYIEKKKDGTYLQHIVPIQPQDVQFVLQQIEEVYASIKGKQFSKGCEQEDCTWCNFVKTYQLQKKSENSIL